MKAVKNDIQEIKELEKCKCSEWLNTNKTENQQFHYEL